MMRGGSHLYSLSRNQSLVILVLFKHAQSLCSRGRYVNCPGPSCHPRESTKPSQLLEGVRGGRWWDGDWSIQKAREMDDVHPLRAQSTPFLFPSMHLDISLSLSSSWCFEDTSWFILLSWPSSEPRFFFYFFFCWKAQCSAGQAGWGCKHPLMGPGCQAGLCAAVFHLCSHSLCRVRCSQPDLAVTVCYQKYSVVYELRREKAVSNCIFAIYLAEKN